MNTVYNENVRCASEGCPNSDWFGYFICDECKSKYCIDHSIFHASKRGYTQKIYCCNCDLKITPQTKKI